MKELFCKKVTLPKVTISILLSTIFSIMNILPALAQNIPAFPGCEGFGAETPGGRGGKVVLVTNLNDAGPGSLRDALMQTGPRIIVFKVSGTIEFNSHIELKEQHSYVTVAGQTAPGDGIALKLYPVNGFYIGGAHDVVISYLRIRGGQRTVMVRSNSYNVVFNHNSITWSTDDTIGNYGDNIHDVTYQWNIIGEAGDGQSSGGLNSGGNPHERITYHHNYLVHTEKRNWKVNVGRYDFINNVSYNNYSWGFQFSQHSSHTGNKPISPDVINHYFKEGPNSNRPFPFTLQRQTSGTLGPISLYLSGSVAIDINGKAITYSGGIDLDDEWSMVKLRTFKGYIPDYEKRNQPNSIQPKYPVTKQSADAGKDLVLANAGATLPKRDPVDTRLIGDFSDHGRYNLSNTGKFPNLQTYNVPQDSDNDGMPDDWEIAHGLNPNDGTDHKQDRNGDGYTNIEEWISSIVGAGPNPPSVILAASSISGEVPFSVSFTSSASKGTPPYGFSWDFGDGGNSTEQNPFHTFESSATYLVVLTITDSENNSFSNSIIISVKDPREPSQHSINALKAATPMTIDGVLLEDAWKQAEFVVFSNPVRSDNQVKVYTLWDKNFLYFAYEVTDTALEAQNQNLWQDDGVEIYLDTENDKTISMDSNDYHLLANINDQTQPNIFDVKTTTQNDGYTMEISIPWSQLNTESAQDKTIGLLLSNSDRDKGISVQFDWLNLIETGSYARPNLWGEIVLSPTQVGTKDLEAPSPPQNLKVVIEE